MRGGGYTATAIVLTINRNYGAADLIIFKRPIINIYVRKL
jgi:hypothetical protein